MIYSEEEARKLVICACKNLVEKKLIARTWGNVSARISEDEFVITPSGQSYQTMTESDLVKVKISDLSYSGDIKPSSEKGVHASAYALRKNAGFVIHTHQPFASAVSTVGLDTPFAPCAKYGLPGTKKLRKAVSKSISENPSSDCFLMQRHGTLCIGATYEKCFENAYLLEEKSQDLFEKNKVEVSDYVKTKPFLDDYAQIMGKNMNPISGEDTDAICMIVEKNSLAASYTNKAKPMKGFDVLLQNFVYRKKYSKLKDSKK